MIKTIYVAIIRGRASVACEDAKALRMWIAGRPESLLYTIDTIPILEVKACEPEEELAIP